MRIYTSNYQNCKSPKGISISGDGGKKVGFQGKRIKELAPKLSWWKVWHDNIGKIPEDENLAFYIKSYYETVLKPFMENSSGVDIPDGTILLCYEEPADFCHRQIVAAFLELLYGQDVPEIVVHEDGTIKRVPRNKYYADIKRYLDSLIRESIDMHGYECIAAAYLFEKSLFLEENPKLCEEFPVSPEMYRRLADVFEDGYKSKKSIK